MRLKSVEIARLAAFWGMRETEFIQRFTRLSNDRLGLTLVDKPNGECIFLAGGKCAVEAVKPRQCRDFPNLWNFPGSEKLCRALPRVVSESDYRKLVSLAAT